MRANRPSRSAAKPRESNESQEFDESGTIVIASPSNGLRLIEHAIIADDGSTSGLRRLDATLENTALKCLEGCEIRQHARGVGLGFDEMNESTVFDPQRKIADALGLCRLQFGKLLRDQGRVLVGQF